MASFMTGTWVRITMPGQKKSGLKEEDAQRVSKLLPSPSLTRVLDQLPDRSVLMTTGLILFKRVEKPHRAVFGNPVALPLRLALRPQKIYIFQNIHPSPLCVGRDVKKDSLS